MIDPQSKKTYTGTDGQPGFILAWNSKNKTAGKASQQINNVVAPERIEMEIIFEKPIPSKANYHFELTAISDNKTHVNWVYEGNPTPYYLLRVSQMIFRLKKHATGYMQASLVNVKNILEK